MKRTMLEPLGSIIIILLFPILLSQSLAFAFSNSYVTIASSGTIRETTGMAIKFVVAYSLTTSAPESLVQHVAQFDLVIIDFSSCGLASRIKAINPKAIVIAYSSIMSMHTSYSDWNEVNSHEDWFLHDVNGNRIRAVNGFNGWYGMDVGNLGWREHFANRLKALLETYPDLDGMFADNAWDGFAYGVWNVPKEQLPADIGSRWHNDMLGMISYVKGTIGSKLFIVNTSNDDDYVDACDGKMWEGWVHASWYSFDQFISEYYWKPYVDDSLEHVSRRGKYYLALSGTKIPQDPTESDREKTRAIMMYCFCSYLLGVNGTKATFGFNFIDSNDGSLGYYPEFDEARALGSPTGYFYQFGSVYARDFNNGKVLVNPGTSSLTVDLGGEYKTLDGQIVSNVTLDAHSGIILLKT